MPSKRPRRHARRGRSTRVRGATTSSAREHTTNLQPLGRRAEGLDLSAGGLDDVLDDRQTKPAAARGAGSIGAVEAFEQTGQVLGLDADAVVSDAEKRVSVLAPQREDGGRSLARVAQGVFRKVLDDDPEHPRAKGQLELLVADLDLQCDTRALRTLGELRGYGPQHRRGLGRAQRNHLTPGLELAQEEHIVD